MAIRRDRELTATAPTRDEVIESLQKREMPRGITNARLRYISTASLRSGAFSVRGNSEAEGRSIAELADSIAASGIIEPIVVRDAELGVFEVVAGERRLSAARLLNLRDVPCVVKECTESEALMIALTENLQRRDLSPLETAHGLRRLLDECRLTQEEVGKRVGMSQSAIAHYLRLLDLPDEVQSFIHQGCLSMGHGKVLAGIADKQQVLELALECLSNSRSVRDLEASLSSLSIAAQGRGSRRSPKRRREEAELPNGVFVVIKESQTQPHSGTIEIPYSSEQEREWTIVVLSEAGSRPRNGALPAASIDGVRLGGSREGKVVGSTNGCIPRQSLRHYGPHLLENQTTKMLKRVP